MNEFSQIANFSKEELKKNCVTEIYNTFNRSNTKFLVYQPHLRIDCTQTLGLYQLVSFYGCFHTTAKCVFWIVIRNAHLESRFEIQYFGPCVRQKTSRIVIWDAHLKSRFRCVLELRISNHDSRCFLAYTRSKYRILNRDSRCASRITIQNTHFAVVWKQFTKMANGIHMFTSTWLSRLHPTFNDYWKNWHSQEIMFGKKAFADINLRILISLLFCVYVYLLFCIGTFVTI